MIAIVVYDVDADRVAKVCQFLRRFLTHVQNSVFEGEVSGKNLAAIRLGLEGLLKDDDAALVYTVRDQSLMRREVLGVEKRPITNIL